MSASGSNSRRFCTGSSGVLNSVEYADAFRFTPGKALS
jgi:hypothetical protein